MKTQIKTEDDSVSCIRESLRAIRVTTDNPLNDEQMQDLLWAALLMSKSGKTLREIIKNGPVDRTDGEDHQRDTVVADSGDSDTGNEACEG